MSTSPPLVIADRYRLVAPLGQGGMGRVWRATDVVLHRDVAIKELVPPPGLTPEERQEMRERSLREARAIARLNNINVVRVFDVLRTDADPWIVMEYVPSRSLQDRLASNGPFPPVRAAEIGLGVLNALRAAHRNGVVHRDVKPGNVLIGEDGRVVLTDFGLATVPGDPNVTRTGLVLGSPAYIAPERARDGTAGPAADLWSLGATLYAAVEGASPFARSSAIATLAALATENPPPARNAGPLKPVLNGLLRKDPTHRINADEAERLLLRASGRKSKLTFPMSPTMRRPGVGRERPAYQAGPPVIPGAPTAAGSAPVVPGPRPPVTSGRPPVTPGRTSGESRPPVAPGRTSGEGRPPVTPDRSPGSDDDHPPVFTPGKASVGRAPRPAETRIDAPAVRDDQDFSGTGYSAPTSTPGHGALAKGTPGTYGTITPGAAAQRNAASESTAVDAEAQRTTTEREAAERKVAAELEAAQQRQAEEQAAAERRAADRVAEREAAQRAAAEREAAHRAAAERKAAEREAAERAAAEREAAERAEAEREVAQRKAEQEAAQRKAEQQAAEREAAERADREAQQREAAERAAAERQAAEREAEDGQAESDVEEGTAQSADAEQSSVDPAARKVAANKPVVGARAGAHTSKAARKKGRGRTSTGGTQTPGSRAARPASATTPAVEASSAAATPAVDSGPVVATSTSGVSIDAPTTASTAAVDAVTPANTDPAVDASDIATDRDADEDALTGADEEAIVAPDTDHPTEEEEAAGGTVVPIRTGSDEADPPRGSKSKPKVAAALSGERKVTTATLGPRKAAAAESMPSATTLPESGPTGTRPLEDAGAGVPPFTGSSRPAWQPMPVRPPTSDRGLTVLGTTLTRRQTVIGGAILAALLLLLALLVPKAVGDDKQSGRTTGAAPAGSAAATQKTTAPATTQATPSQRPTTAQPSTGGGTVALPAGWYLYHDDKTGFSVPAPKGWSVRRQGTEVYFEERGGQYRLMIVDQTNQPKPDPVKDWQTQEAARIGGYRNYHRISIHAVSYWDKAADWEFTRTSDNGNPLHVVKRGFITAKDRAYGITWSTSAGDWDANKANLQLIYKGFVPAKS